MLYVARSLRESQEKRGLPSFIHRVYTEAFNEKDPMQGMYTSNWKRYNRHQDGTPVPESLRLPAQLLLVCKGVKRFNPDFFSDSPIEWLVSAEFRAFLQQHRLLEGHYEESALTVLSDKNKPIADKQYYLLRLIHNDNALIDFAQTPTVVSTQKPLTKHTPPKVYYPDLVFRQGVTAPPLFFLDDPSYWYSFICNEDIKAAMEQEQFQGINFYTLEAYVQDALYREKYPLGPPSDRPKPLS